LTGPASSQLAALKPEIAKLMSSLGSVAGVKDATYMIEAILPSFYLPGYGLRGVPLYLLGNADHYRTRVYSEPSVGLTADFETILSRVDDQPRILTVRLPRASWDRPCPARCRSPRPSRTGQSSVLWGFFGFRPAASRRRSRSGT
jgi:hypothetical protein